MKTKLSGETKPCLVAKKEPAKVRERKRA